MRRLNSVVDCIQIILRRPPSGVHSLQHVVQMLAQFASLLRDQRTAGIAQFRQSPGKRPFDEPCQFCKSHQLAVAGEVLDRRWKGPLIERVHQIERGMASTPVEWSSTITHGCYCLLSTYPLA